MPLVLAAVISLFVTKVSGLVCLSCSSITKPRHCHEVEECQPGQYCASERFSDRFGDVYYNIGCTDEQKCHSNQTKPIPGTTLAECTECCQGDLCNSNLCGAPDYPTSTGPICYSCKSLPNNRKCRQIDICQTNEICFAEETEEFGDYWVSSGCKSSLSCHVLAVTNTSHINIVGKRSLNFRSWSHTQCIACCDRELCNENCLLIGTRPQNQMKHGMDCLEIKSKWPSSPTGPYNVTLKSGKSITVWCDMTTDGGGWTVFQKRFDGSVDFYKTFSSYRHGFGNITGEFWLGLENLFQLTVDHNNSLWVDVTGSNGSYTYAKMTRFNIGPGSNYTLHVGGIETGNSTGGEMTYFNGHMFSTRDMDQDGSTDNNCAERYHGAMWYNGCYLSANPNALYGPGVEATNGMHYNTLVGDRAMQMKIRRNV